MDEIQGAGILLNVHSTIYEDEGLNNILNCTFMRKQCHFKMLWRITMPSDFTTICEPWSHIWLIQWRDLILPRLLRPASTRRHSWMCREAESGDNSAPLVRETVATRLVCQRSRPVETRLLSHRLNLQSRIIGLCRELRWKIREIREQSATLGTVIV